MFYVLDGYLKTKKTEEESDIPKNNFNENKLEYWYVYRVIWVCSRKKRTCYYNMQSCDCI